MASAIPPSVLPIVAKSIANKILNLLSHFDKICCVFARRAVRFDERF